jgi:hypothetical protein
MDTGNPYLHTSIPPYLHANCHSTKPIDLNQFLRVVRSIEDFWLSIVMLPPNEAKI